MGALLRVEFAFALPVGAISVKIGGKYEKADADRVHRMSFLWGVFAGLGTVGSDATKKFHVVWRKVSLLLRREEGRHAVRSYAQMSWTSGPLHGSGANAWERVPLRFGRTSLEGDQR